MRRCRRPVVAITVPGEGGRPRVALRLLPTCSPAMLQLRKLAPGSNAVRSILAAPQPDAEAAAAGDQLGAAPSTAPTSHYNASILQVSLFLRSNSALRGWPFACLATDALRTAVVTSSGDDLICSSKRATAADRASVLKVCMASPATETFQASSHDTREPCDVLCDVRSFGCRMLCWRGTWRRLRQRWHSTRLADALALLRGWARQHGFAQQPGGMTGFHLTMLAAHLHSRSALVTLAAAADRPSQHGLHATQC